MSKTKQTVFSNLIWRFAERCGAQVVTFTVSIILARLLEPSAYGTVALMNVFILVLQVFVDSGLGNALIQKKNSDDLDFSTVFYTNIVVCVLLYIVIFFSAPAIAVFYNDDKMTALIRVLSLTVVISGVKNVQQAYISKTMQFKRFFYATLCGTLGAAILGIFLAYQGYGVWALVWQQLFNLFMDTVILWATVSWRPKKQFSMERLRGLFSYGWKLLVSSLINTIYTEIRQLIIGKIYTSSTLSFYNRGKQFPSLFINNVNSAIDSVLLPTMSDVQDDKKRVKDMTRRSIKISIYVMAPFMMGLFFVSETLVSAFLTEKWLPCVPFLRIFCITYMFYPIHTANLNAIKAMGRSDLFLKLEIVKKVVGLIVLFSTVWISVEAMAYSLLFMSLVNQVINSWPNKKLLQYRYLEQMKDIFPSVLLSVAMGIVISFVKMLPLNDWIVLLIQIVLGVAFYVAGSILFRIESFEYLKDILVNFLVKKRK